jgi:hypothetical protein
MEYSKQQIAQKQAGLNRRKWPVKVEGLEKAYDLAQLVKHVMIDKKTTYYVTPDNKKRVQYSARRQRTIEDLTHIANSYGIKVTFEQAQEAAEELYRNGILNYHYCTTVKKQVHNPMNLMLDADRVRQVLGSHNAKNPNYVKSKRKSRKDSAED